MAIEFHFPVKPMWPDHTNGVARRSPGRHNPSFESLRQVLSSLEDGNFDLASPRQWNAPNFKNRKH